MTGIVSGGEFPYPDDPRFVLEVDPGRHEAVIEFRDSLAFHAERACGDEQTGGPLGRSWASLTDANGYLTAEAAHRLAAGFGEILAARGVAEVEVAYADRLEYDDEASVAVLFRTAIRPDESFGMWLDRIGWPVIAQVINCTDPGTWNCPYVFDVLRFN